MLIILKALADFFYPPVCANCDGLTEESGTLCANCRGQLVFTRSYTAEYAGLLYLDEILILARYRRGLQTILQKIKFSGQKNLLPLLTDEFKLLWDETGQAELDCLLQNYKGKTLAVIPVPTDLARLRERGYDLPEQIFKNWSEHQGYQWQTCLERKLNKPPQYGLSGLERKNNMLGVMTAQYLPPEDILLIVDDILTTGATLAECARALRTAGGENKTIIGLALAGDTQTPEKIKF